jgi:hypothetical protein
LVGFIPELYRTARAVIPALLVLLPLPLAAQSRTAGRVVRVSRGDTIPVADIAVVLHRVGRAGQGPIDTVHADRGGRFRFQFAADTTAAFLLSARFAGIEYFSSAIASNPARPDTGVVLVVSDTSSAAPVSVRQRTILVSAVDETGTRTVLDWFVLSNTGERTRVAPDTLHPSWGAPLPPDAQNVALADLRLSQFAPEAVTFPRDSVLVFAPLSPGDKELMLQYRIPGTLRRFVVPGAGPVDSVFVLLEDRGGRVTLPKLVAADSQMIEGRRFLRWAGALAHPGAVEITLSAPWLSAPQVLVMLVGLGGLAFALLAWRSVRRRAPPPRFTPLAAPAALAEAAARLDARYLGRQAEVSAEEWAGYLAERARLTEALARALASGPRRS